MVNPFRTTDHSLKSRPCVVVIFGATGDLTHRKLVPALYNLALDGLLPAQFQMIGFARREMTDDTFRANLQKSTAENSRRLPLQEDIWQEFAAHSTYIRAAFDDQDGYTRLRANLEEIDRVVGAECVRLFYLATSPEYFELITEHLAAARLLAPEDSGVTRSRVIIEKPFGTDLASAKELNQSLLKYMREQQIYRIDHYLGKETVQNLLVFRFGNGIFEPIWNQKYVDHVEISVCETVGVGSRAGYFDKTGILRDIMQNHALQLLCLVALEPPVAFAADAVRDEKVKVLRSVRRISSDHVFTQVVRARYERGYVEGKEVAAYLKEPGVDPYSTTETYAAVRLFLDNWRWAGVPFYLRAGKRLPKRVTDISVFFKQVPYLLFRDQDVESIKPNILSFEIQPDEGISIKISAKPPGLGVRVQTVNMEFSYGTSFGAEPPEAYERLLLDAMRGDATLFTRDDEIEQAWELLNPLLAAWNADHGPVPPVYSYEAGSWGPSVSDDLLQQDGRKEWRRL